MLGRNRKIALGIGMTLCGAVAGLAAANVYPPPSDNVPLRAPDHTCSKGGETKTFGMTEWVIFSCEDDRTLVFVAAAGNPADPFYFTLYPEGTEYHVFGEGTGNTAATDAAFEEIQLLSSADIRALIAHAKATHLP